MNTLKHLVSFVILMFCFSILNAQEMTPKKYDNLQWYAVTMIKFEDGKMEDAKKIINEHFIPTDEAAGQQGPVMALDLIFSEWDHIVVFQIEEGIEALEWERSPREVAWMKALHERTGGEEKGKEILAQFESYVKEYKTMLARTTGQP